MVAADYRPREMLYQPPAVGWQAGARTTQSISRRLWSGRAALAEACASCRF